MNGNNTSCHLYSCHKERNNAIAMKGGIVMETILDKTSDVLENHLYHSRLHPEQKIELEWRIKKADKIKTSPRLVFIRS